MEKDNRIYVAGHCGLVGSAIVRNLEAQGYDNLVLRSHAELDLTDQAAVRTFFETERPEYVFLAAAKVGGIVANSTYPAEFIGINLMIQTNVIDSAYRSGAKKMLFLGSSCIYPKHAPQPMKEEHLLTGALEPTNEWYAIAKIAGIRMCQAYRRQYGFDAISAMPTNLYGPNDNYDLQNSHVIPALIRKFSEAVAENRPEVVIWGTGKPRREFLHVDDMADACVFLMNHYSDEQHVNVGCGEDVSIGELAELLRTVSEYAGKIVYDTSKPDGTPRKLLSVQRLAQAGWKPRISLENGIAASYKEYHGRTHG